MENERTEDTKAPGFEGWGVLELMGHRKLAGRISEAEIAGAGFLRIDIPGPDGKDITQFYRPGALYGLTPTTEAVARAMSRRYQPEPVSRYDLALPPAPVVSDAEVVDEDRDEGLGGF